MRTMILTAVAIAAAFVALPAAAQHRNRTVTVEGPNGNSASRSVTVDRWRRPPPPADYRGVRAGYWYAPGYGYYAPPRAYRAYRWDVGVVVPVNMRRYVIVDPAIYALPPAPVGLRWIYVGNRVALIRTSNGTIVRLGPVYW